MKGRRGFTFLAWILVFARGFVGAQAQAGPSFTVTAGNAAMPSSGFGIIPFTLTSTNGYVGPVIVSCMPTTPPAGANIPTCGAPEPYGNGFQGGGVSVNLTADSAVVKGGIFIYALPASISEGWNALLHHPETEGTTGWALASVMTLGLTFPRWKARRSTRGLLVIITLIGLAGIVACVGPFPKAPSLTPGTYTYTVTAVGTSFSASTTVTVTVPPGVVVL